MVKRWAERRATHADETLLFQLNYPRERKADKAWSTEVTEP